MLIRKKPISLLNIELILNFFVFFKPLYKILLDIYIFNKQKNILKQLLVKTFLSFLLFWMWYANTASTLAVELSVRLPRHLLVSPHEINVFPENLIIEVQKGSFPGAWVVSGVSVHWPPPLSEIRGYSVPSYRRLTLVLPSTYPCLTLVLPSSYPWLTLVLPLSYPCLILVLHLSYHCFTLALPLSYPRLTLVLPLSYPCLTLVIPLSYPCLTLVLPSSYPRLTLVLPSSYPRLTLVLPSSYPCLTLV